MTLAYGQPYDKKDVNSILDHARQLVGHTLKEKTSAPMMIRETPAVEVKGFFGQYLEKYYFDINNNSDSKPDFKEVGLELKSNPIRQLKNGMLAAKERIVLNIIDYMNIVDETWEQSHFLSKNEFILFVMYLYEGDKTLLEFLIKYVTLWKLEGDDREIIRQDWERIVKKIRDGRAHELSEGDTFYLGACRKGWKEAPRQQPFSDIGAPQRAFSFKTKYVNSILGRLEGTENVITDTSQLRTRTFEEIIYDRFSPFIGLATESIEHRLSVDLNRSAKGYYATLARRMMGVEASKIAEFEKADVSMKIIRLKHNGAPKEDMSFPYFRPMEIKDQTWGESDFSSQLERKFFFVVYQMDKDEKEVTLKKAFFWNIPAEDLERAKNVWERAKELIVGPDPEQLPKKSENRVSHVRPHARDSSDTVEYPNGQQIVKKCFWLNAGYLKEVVERN